MIEWLASTPGSVALHESHYVFLAILTIHVLTLFVFAGLAAVIDLRLLGLMLRQVRVSQLVRRLVPWTAGGMSMMLASGALLFYAAPVERFSSVFFRLKLVLLTLALANVVVFHRIICRRVADWDCAAEPPAAVRIAGGLGLALWAGIIVAGRMVPYERYWF
jgi:hypothetical protein